MLLFQDVFVEFYAPWCGKFKHRIVEKKVKPCPKYKTNSKEPNYNNNINIMIKSLNEPL